MSHVKAFEEMNPEQQFAYLIGQRSRDEEVEQLRRERKDDRQRIRAANTELERLGYELVAAEAQVAELRRLLHRAEYAARVQEREGNEGDADAIRRDAMRSALGLGIGEALPSPPASSTGEER